MTSSPPLPTRSLSQSGPSSSFVPLSASRNNPISLRIYKALGTSFDDPSSREALEIASRFYSQQDSKASKGKGRAEQDGIEATPNGTAPPESQASTSDADEEQDGLVTPRRRTLRGQTAMTARKYLKRDVERKLAGGSQKFLQAFGEVDKVSFQLPAPS
jgi:hypothetical protein